MRTTSVAVAVCLLGLASAADAQLPDGRGNGRGRSPDIERALSNRADVARSQGLALGAERGIGFDSRAAAQSGTGRLGSDSPWERGQGVGIQDRLPERFRNQAWGRERRDAAASVSPEIPAGDAPEMPAAETPVRRADPVAHGANRRGWLANRLANIDHLRDVALRNGNVQLLEQADRLEAHARQQHLWRTGQIDHPHGELPPEIEGVVVVGVGVGDVPVVDPPMLPPDDSINPDASVPPIEFESSTLPEPRRLPEVQ
jgi:hypothetical protein